MIKIENGDRIKKWCRNCKSEFAVQNSVDIGVKRLYLCDECLQELNRKIVEHLAEKNL